MNHQYIKTYLLALLCLICCGSAAVAQTTPDPGLPGLLPVTKASYDLGDLAYSPPTFPNPVEVRGSVHYPTGLSGGPYPVLVFLHGRHSTCYNISTPDITSLRWPCPTGYSSIVSFEGYDYLAQNMASHGYIVISISCNAINAADNALPDYGMQARGELMQHHLDLWKIWNTTGAAPFATLFAGKLDMNNIGTMGHSRGGEGVVFHALHNRALGSPYGIKAVVTLAPVDFKRKILNGIPLLNVAPYCDGDVSNVQGVHFYDDARYNDTVDEAPKHSVLMMGANHNFYNTVWTPGSYIAGGADDWDEWYSSYSIHCGSRAGGTGRMDTAIQKAALNAYMAAFYRVYMGHERIYAPILETDDIVPPVSARVGPSSIFMSYHPGRSSRMDINRIDTAADITTNTLSGAVATSGLVTSAICGGGVGMTSCAISTSTDQEPHRGTSSVQGLAQMNMSWNDTTSWYDNEVPAAQQDFTGFERLTFRAAVNFHTSATGVAQDFTIQLTDSAGNVAGQLASTYSNALFFAPGIERSTLPKIMFNTISIPLAGFTGIDMATVRSIRFLFNKTAAGGVLITDLAVKASQCGKFSVAFGDSISGAYSVKFRDSSITNTGDTIARLWQFGDPTSGTADTSSLAAPSHTYTVPGTYTTCLSLIIRRPTGVICSDSVCASVTIAARTAIQDNEEPEIRIIPNPAKDYLQVTGAASTDVLRLIDMYGKVVFATTLGNGHVQLPQQLAAGIYYAVIATANGNVYQKLLIAR